MSTQTLEFNATSGLTITCKLFALESDTVVASVAATERTNDRNRYRVAFEDIPPGAYRLNGFVGTVGGFANEIYDLLDATSVYLPRSEAEPTIAGPVLVGPNVVTISVVDAVDGTPIPGAKVRMYRGTQSQSQVVDTIAVSFAVASETWTVAVSAHGYDSHVSSRTVNGNLPITVSLSRSTAPSADDLAAGACDVTVRAITQYVAVPTGATARAIPRQPLAVAGGRLIVVDELPKPMTDGSIVLRLHRSTAYTITIQYGDRERSINYTTPNSGTALAELTL